MSMADQELERFKTDIDLRLYAAHHGYELDRKESWAGSAVMRHINHDKVIIKVNATDRHWVYFSVRDDADHGTVIDFAKRRLNASLGAVRKDLRAFLGLPSSVVPPYPPLRPVVRSRMRIEHAYARMRPLMSHPYLEGARAIPLAVLQDRRFHDRIRVDERSNVVFPHFDEDGLCGFELKAANFTSFSAGGVKGLWVSQIEKDDRHLVLCESGVESLSHAALFPNPHARYASLGGKPSLLQRDLIRRAAARMPENGVVVAAMNNDTPGRELAEIVAEAVSLTGRSDLRFEKQEPEIEKDWNDQLRSRPRSSLTVTPDRLAVE